MVHNCTNSIDMRYPFDARCVAKRFRHAAIFGAQNQDVTNSRVDDCES